MALTKVGPKFQVTIPKVAREAIGLNVGDLLEATTTRVGVVLRPKIAVEKSSLAILQAQAERSGKSRLSLREIEAEVATVRKEKTKRSA